MTISLTVILKIMYPRPFKNFTHSVVSEQNKLSTVKRTKIKSLKADFVTWTFRLPPKRQLSILLNFFLAFIDIRCFFSSLKLLSNNHFGKQAIQTFLWKPLFKKRWWPCDFLPRRTPIAQKHCMISCQEEMAFSTPVGLSWDSPLPPPESVRTGMYADVATKISRLDP